MIAAGRDTAKLAELTALGADEICTFDQLGRAADVDVVIDYVWGEPTAAAMVEILTNRADRGRPLTWLEIGAIAGPEAAIPAAALRAARLQIVGSGIGSVSGRDFVKELPKLAEAVADGAFDVRAKAVPLAEVEQVWTRTAGRATGSCLCPDRYRQIEIVSTSALSLCVCFEHPLKVRSPMAKSGTSSSVVGRDSSRSAGTRIKLIEAAIETLKAEGFAGSSARAIAERAGVNQGLIFYHFDSVANLLLAALDSVSVRRMEHYGAAIDRVGSPTELVDVATAIFREDLDAGYVAVLVEMIAGASSTPGLGPEVSARLGPWFAFAERAVTTTLGPPLDSVLPPGDVAYGIVALYLGLEMLTHLDGDRARALGLFAHAKNLAGLLEALAPPAATRQP